jgi:hypothetical protein
MMSNGVANLRNKEMDCFLIFFKKKTPIKFQI